MAIVSIVPSTGWLVRLQLREFAKTLVTRLQESREDYIARDARVAASNPENFDIQVGYCLELASRSENLAAGRPVGNTTCPDGLSNDGVRRLGTLSTRFGDRPALYAHILRLLSQTDVRLHREDVENILLSPAQQKDIADGEKAHGVGGRFPAPSATPLRLAEDSARKGEALDPANAFFPTMLALTYLTQHRDTDAVVALQWASLKPEWRDYTNHEATASIALDKASQDGEISAFSRSEYTYGDLFPYLNKIRSMARVMTGIAVKQELLGKREEGLAVRKALARLGATMRSHSQSGSCSFVGGDIVRESALRPGGAVTPDLPEGQEDAFDEARYIAYLARIGNQADSPWFAAERAADRRADFIVGTSNNTTNYGLDSIFLLARWWMVCLFFFVSFLLVVATGGIAALLCRYLPLMTRSALDKAFGAALAFVVLEAALVAAVALASDGRLETVIGLVAPIEPFCLIGIAIVLKWQATWRMFAARVAVFLTTLLGATCLIAAATWLGHGITTPLCLLGFKADGIPLNYAHWLGMPRVWLLGVPVLLPMIALAALLAVRARSGRKAIAAAIVRGFPSGSIAVAGVLLLLYDGSIAVTLRQESAVRDEINRKLVSEGQDDADAFGVEWPRKVEIAPGAN